MTEKIQIYGFWAVLICLFCGWLLLSCQEVKEIFTSNTHQDSRAELCVYIGEEVKCYSVKVNESSTALSILYAAGLKPEIKMYEFGALVTKIAGDDGQGQIWFTKNGELVMQSADKVKVSAGDKISWYVYPNKP